MNVHKKKRLVAALAVAVGLAGSLAGCSGGSGGSDNAASDKAQSSALDTIKERKVIKIGVNLSQPPMGTKNSDGKAAGYEVEIGKQIAASLKVKPEFVDTTLANRIPNLTTGKVDIVIALFFANPERAQVVSFTHPYVTESTGIATKANSDIHSLKDLDGKKVAVSKGSANIELIKAAAPNAKIQQFDQTSDEFQSLKRGIVEAAVEDGALMSYALRNDKGYRVFSDDELKSKATYYDGIGVRLGDQRMINYLNLWIWTFIKSGANDALYAKFVGQPPLVPVEAGNW